MFPYIPLSDWLLLDSWRVMISLGILAGSLVSLILLQGEIGRLRATLLVASMAASSLFGAHLAYWLLHPGLYGWDLYGILVFWKDGHSLLGAFGVCALLLLAISRIVPGIAFWPTADAFALGVPVGLFFARIGCYMKGCCWGTPIGEGHPFHGLSVKLVRNDLLTLHPVQLYSAAAALAVFGILLALRRRNKTPGILTILFILLYASARFFLEFFRGDTPALFAGLTLYQGVCLALFASGTGLLIFLLRDARR
jgi:phosphatidylglycerol:prolipoprotein diacylglycerol transferase